MDERARFCACDRKKPQCASAPYGLRPGAWLTTIARHVPTSELHTHLSSIALGDLRPTTPPPTPSDETGRSAQRFVVDVVAMQNGKTRRITARGRDIYAFTAPLVCEAVASLLDGNFSGVGARPPGAIFNAQKFLSALTAEDLAFEITAE